MVGVVMPPGPGALSEGLDHIGDPGFGRRAGWRQDGVQIPGMISGHAHFTPVARWAHRFAPREGIAQRPLMPELRHDPRPGRLHPRDHMAPAFLGSRAGDLRNVGRVDGGRMRGADPLGHNEANAAFDPAPVMGRDIRTRDVPRRELPRHRRHH